MLQKLLAQRFGLAFHREGKDIPGYALMVGKNGPKLKLAGSSPTPVTGRDGFADVPDGLPAGAINVESAGSLRRVTAGAMSLAEFANYLAGQTDGPISDMTHLTGKYDIVLYYPFRPRQTQASSTSLADIGPDLASALREQLGLELRPQKVAAEQLVIDHIDKVPSPN
jgi:uncharacterized protein (TIGR03435 family)